jgi:hypothetical protein
MDVGGKTRGRGGPAGIAFFAGGNRKKRGGMIFILSAGNPCPVAGLKKAVFWGRADLFLYLHPRMKSG